MSATPCNASHITWSKTGGQCLNCGGTGPNCFSVKHATQSAKSQTKAWYELQAALAAKAGSR